MVQIFEYICLVFTLTINQSINVYSPKQPTGFSNRRRLADPLVDNIEICTGVDIQGNIIYREYAQQVQDPQHDPPTHPGPVDINQVQENCMKDPKKTSRQRTPYPTTTMTTNECPNIFVKEKLIRTNIYS